jgi:tripartite-type tricarboxylate transporter receptor subunit TctC
MRAFRTLACALALASLPLSATAQTPSDKMIRLIVGYPAGGSSDTLARMVAEKLRGQLGATIIVENRPGAGGQIAADYVRQQPGDGATLLVANSHMMVMLPLTSKSTKYNPTADFMPVGRIATFYEAVTLPASASASNLTQWLDAVRKDASLGSFGVPAAGSVSHFLGYRLGLDAKMNLLPVPYKGAAPLVQDLLGKHVAAGIVPVLDGAEHSKEGKLKVIAVNGAKRAQLLPDVPTLKELGIDGFEALEWTALLAPAATPKAVVERLNTALNAVLADADIKQKLLQLGMESATGTPEEMGKIIAADVAQWEPVVKASGFTAD